jgi:hypothetical protein
LLDDLDAADALPLLAFTLERLLILCGSKHKLTLEDYGNKLGGLSGAIQSAVDAALGPSPSEETLELARELWHPSPPEQVSYESSGDTFKYRYPCCELETYFVGEAEHVPPSQFRTDGCAEVPAKARNIAAEVGQHSYYSYLERSIVRNRER